MLAPHRGRHVDELRVDHADGNVVEPVDGIEAVLAERISHRRPLAELGGEDLGGDGPVGAAAPTATRRVPGPALGRRHVERNGDHGDAVPAGQRHIPAPPVTIESQRVDDGQQPAPQPALQDQVQHGERIGAGPLVLLTLTDQGPDPVRRDDLLGPEPLRRPMRLATPRRPDQHHQARDGQPDHGS